MNRREVLKTLASGAVLGSVPVVAEADPIDASDVVIQPLTLSQWPMLVLFSDGTMGHFDPAKKEWVCNTGVDAAAHHSV